MTGGPCKRNYLLPELACQLILKRWHRPERIRSAWFMPTDFFTTPKTHPKRAAYLPTIFSHPTPVLALGLAAGRRAIPGRLLLAGLVCSVLPDMDVVGFMMKVSYGDTMGHRGASHSLLFAASLAGMALAQGPVGLFAAWVLMGVAMGSGPPPLLQRQVCCQGRSSQR